MLKKPSQSVGVPSQPKIMNQAQVVSLNLEFMNLQEVAQWLRVSRISVYRMIAKRILSFYRIGNRMFIAKKDVVAFLEKNRYVSKEG